MSFMFSKNENDLVDPDLYIELVCQLLSKAARTCARITREEPY